MVLWTCSSSKKWTPESVIFAAALDHDLVGRVYHDFGHIGVPEKLLDGAELKEVIDYVLGSLALDALVFLGEGGGACTYARARSRSVSMPSDTWPTSATWF